MNATPATLVRQTRTARRINRVSGNVVYSTRSGQTSFVPRVEKTHAQRVAECAWLRTEGTHVLCNVEADLPGDRSVGTCDCGEYIDTGTWDERN